MTVAVDSPATVDAAQRAGLREVLIDVNVGLPRCGCRPTTPGAWPGWPAAPASRCGG